MKPPAPEGVILAAGRSTRAGAFKPGLPIRGRPMIHWTVDSMRCVCGRVIVVGGFRHRELADLLLPLPDVVCLENPRYAEGMFTSVKTGLAEVRADACFVLPADVPFVPAGVFHALLAVSAPIVVPRYHGRGGHPVLLRAGAVEAALAEPDASSLRRFIRRTGATAVDTGAPEVLLDIDTEEDYRSILRTPPPPSSA